MERNIHPLAVTLVVALCIGAVAAWLYCSHLARSLGGPAGLSIDPRGHLFIQIQNQLLEHDSGGAFIERHDLGELGVDVLLGDTAFFSNGDLLVRRGADTRRLRDTVRAFLRRTNTNDIEVGTPNTGLYRCSLSSKKCRVFGKQPIDFASAFSLAIDRTSDEVYVSDSSRHLVRKYSRDGERLAPPASGFRFPNQLVLHDDVLLVADTNQHRVRALNPTTDRFGTEFASFDVIPPRAASDGRRWPSHFARVGDGWWVNNMTSAMNYGRIDVFDAEWRHQRAVILPERADPIDLVAFNGDVLITDWYGDRVHRVSERGQLLGDFQSEGLDQVLIESEQKRDFYKLCGWLAVLLAAGLTTIIVFKGTDWSGPRTRHDVQNSGNASGGQEQVSFAPDEKKVAELRRSMRVVAWLSLPGVVAIPVLAYFIDSASVTLQLVGCGAGFFGLLALIRWSIRVNTSTSIDIDGDRVRLRGHGGRDAHGSPSKVQYTDHVVAAGDVAVVFGQGKMALYDRGEIVGELERRLGPAQRISPWAMQKKLIAIGHPNGVLTVLFMALGLIVGLLIALR